MAWLLFFEFIFTYEGTDFIRLPGLVRRFLIFRLLRLMKQQGVRWDTECYLEAEEIVDEAKECEPLEKMLNDLALEQIFNYLPHKEMRVIDEYYRKNNNYGTVAHNLKCTPRSVRYYKGLALDRLKKHFEI